MNEDTMNELLLNNQENFKKVFALLETVVSGLSNLESRVAALEAKDAITKPLWQEMRTDQKRILDILQEHSARMDRIEARLQQQDEKITGLDEKMTVGFRKLGDKFDLLAQDYYDLHADVVDLRRRVTRLEPVN